MKEIDFESINTIEDIKNYGSEKEWIDLLNGIVAPMKVNIRSFQDVLSIVELLKSKWAPMMQGCFVSKKAEYIFYLTKLEGKQRNKLLGISDEMYENKELAKSWYKNIAKSVHPDSNNGDESKAFLVLKELYDNMVDDCEE